MNLYSLIPMAISPSKQNEQVGMLIEVYAIRRQPSHI